MTDATITEADELRMAEAISRWEKKLKASLTAGDDRQALQVGSWLFGAHMAFELLGLAGLAQLARAAQDVAAEEVVP